MKHKFGLQNLKLGTRLALGFGMLVVISLALTVLSIHRVASINASLTTIGEANSVIQRYAINFRGSVHDRAIALRDVTLITDPERLQAKLALIKKLAADYAQSAAPLDKMIANPKADADERSALAAIKAIEAKAMPLTAQVIELRLAGQDKEAVQKVLDQAGPAYVEWLGSTNRLIDLEEAKNKVESTHARAVAQSFKVLMIVLCASGLGIGLLFAWIVTRGILQELGTEPGTAAMLVHAVAQGDLSARIEVRQGDSTSLMVQLREMQRSLISVVSDVRRN